MWEIERVPFVPCLVFRCLPRNLLTAVREVTRFVIAIRIRSIKTVLLARAWTNISKERVKVISPLLAYRYTTSAVVPVGLMARIVAANDHHLPDLVLLLVLIDRLSGLATAMRLRAIGM